MYGTAHTATMPVVGVTSGPTYATEINAAIDEIRATVDNKVTPAGMDIDANLSFTSGTTAYSATDVKSIGLDDQSSALSASTFAEHLYASSGNLFFNDNAGNQIQMTTGGGVNVSTSGGITGAGYGSGGVEVNWASGVTAYKMRSGAGADDYADIWSGNLLLNDGSGNFATIAPPSLASDYTMTLPTAVPASTSLLMMAATGALSTSLTPTLTTLTTTGVTTSGGLITASAGLTAAANQHVTVSGTGVFKHGDKISVLPAYLGVAGSAWVINVLGYYDASGGAGNLLFPIPVILGWQITQVEAKIRTDNVRTSTFALYRIAMNTGTVTQLGSNQVSTTGAGNIFESQTVGSLTESASTDRAYYCSFASSGSSSDLRVYGVNVTYNQP